MSEAGARVPETGAARVDETGAARVRLALGERAPVEVMAACGVTITIRAACDAGCNRTGLALMMTMPGGVETSRTFAAHEEGVSIAAMTLTAPAQLGEHRVRAVLPAHAIEGVAYAEAVLDVALRVIPQTTSLAVWDVPAPVVAGTRFAVSAGAKSVGGCPLAGQPIEVRDAGGAVVARGTLSSTPLAGTSALYWCELSCTASDMPGVATWTVRFAADTLAIPHEGAATTFTTAVVAKPEHRLTVKVVDEASAAPLADVELRLGAFRGTTGENGTTEIALPKGQYELRAWKVGYDAAPRALTIDADAMVEIAAHVVPEEDPDARWRM